MREEAGARPQKHGQGPDKQNSPLEAAGWEVSSARCHSSVQRVGAPLWDDGLRAQPAEAS